MAVDQNHAKGIVFLLCRLDRGQCQRSAFRGKRPHSPSPSHVAEDPPVSVVVIDDQHRKISQARFQPRRRGLSLLCGGRKARGERECASFTSLLSTQIFPAINSASRTEI